ncbi:hypothetical protein L6452_18506 [Arctium lappa]|uniref:Uncharacterized protein n=1 Tax=Arctium lappa TaxID=4217 RepID=A0ACB9C6G9_ARCLA|nr:hypothetical protein L6452_18506 [Arctium lappa]
MNHECFYVCRSGEGQILCSKCQYIALHYRNFEHVTVVLVMLDIEANASFSKNRNTLIDDVELLNVELIYIEFVQNARPTLLYVILAMKINTISKFIYLK